MTGSGFDQGNNAPAAPRRRGFARWARGGAGIDDRQVTAGAVPPWQRELAATLSSALTPTEVLDVLADVGRPALGAESIDISVLDESAQVLRLVTSRRSAPQVRIRFATYRANEPYPTRDALLSRRPVLIRSQAERDERWPALQDIKAERVCWMVLPLLADGVPLGTVGLGWSTPQEFGPEQVQACEQVAALVAAALARAQRYDAEREARVAAEELAHRLGVLQALTSRLARATDLATVGDLIVGAGLTALGADAATIGVLEGDDKFTVLSTVGLPPEVIPRWSTHDLAASALAQDVIATLEPVLITSQTDRETRYPDQPMADESIQASATLPLLVADHLMGMVAYGWRSPRAFDGPDVEYLTAIASHAAAAIDRSRLLAARERTAETLQRALLPQVVEDLPGWDLASCYLPAVEGTQVGGDWYDAFPTDDGRLVLVLGDVAGKGVHAAAVMGAVRSSLRAFATVDPAPATILRRLDAYFAAFKPDELVTCTIAVLQPDTGQLTYASAGHLPALVLHPASDPDRGRPRDPGDPRDRARWLDEATSPPLGANGDPRHAVPRRQAGAAVDAGQVLLLFSDGLLERRDRDLRACLDDLAVAAADLPMVPDLARATAELATTMQNPGRVVDDIAILALRRAVDPGR